MGRKLGLGVLRVRFRNLSDRPIDRVVFSAAYLSGGFDIIRDLPIETPTSFISLDEPSGCTTVSARYGDGTMWESPVAGPTEPPLPTLEPSN